jgi:hypothetical protein
VEISNESDAPCSFCATAHARRFGFTEPSTYRDRAYAVFFAGDYDRAEFACRLGLSAAVANQNVMAELVILTRVLRISNAG